ncbi:MAG: hypothetical protein EOM58_07150, partial [Clostridia bacterium]|nr:hypothetical protein [Clostridia bacterium]
CYCNAIEDMMGITAPPRAQFLREVFEESGFVTAVKGDLVTASLTGAGRETVRGKLVMIGRLIGFTRCLDAVMRDDSTAHLLAEGFLAGNYDSAKILEGKETVVDELRGAEEAQTVIQKSLDAYINKFCR